jgi:hypothetical protein
VECQYKLLTFGINPKLLPVDFEGHIVRTTFWEWILSRRRIEAAIQEADALPHDGHCDIIDYPTSADVLHGKGRPYQEFPGNMKLQELVESNLALHHAAESNAEKTRITKTILQLIKVSNGGGRFLKKEREDGGGGGWVEVSDKVAQDKVSHLFRNLKKTIRRRAGKLELLDPFDSDNSYN